MIPQHLGRGISEAIRADGCETLANLRRRLFVKE